MAFFPFKEGGTATLDAGRYTTKPTGSFASLGVANYYNDEAAARAATTPPTVGDILMASDAESSTGTDTRTFGTEGTPYAVVSVNDTAMENSRRSGNRSTISVTSSSSDINMIDVSLSGFDFTSSDNFALSGVVGNVLQDGSITLTGSGDLVTAFVDGGNTEFINWDFTFNNAGGNLAVSAGGKVKITGGSATSAAGGNLFSGGFANGGGTVDLFNFDLTNIDGVIIANTGSNADADDLILVRMDLCPMHASADFTNEAFKSRNHDLLATRCGSTEAIMEYGYHRQKFGGTVIADTTIFRDEDLAFPSGQRISYRVNSNSDAQEGYPLTFEFPAIKEALLSQANNKKVTLFITSATAIDNKQVYARMRYVDSADNTQTITIASSPITEGGTYDILATGTTLDTDSASTWTGALTFVYEIIFDTTSLAGEDCTPEIDLFITDARTFYLASDLGIS